jgi:hypothetical protein
MSLTELIVTYLIILIFWLWVAKGSRKNKFTFYASRLQVTFARSSASKSSK